MISGTTARTLSTTTYRRGDIVLVSFPFTDLSSTKRRPALVISPNSFNALKQDLILAAITSQMTDDKNTVVLEEQDFRDGHLPKRSMVRLTKLFTIHTDLLVKRVCRLSEEKDGRDPRENSELVFVTPQLLFPYP